VKIAWRRPLLSPDQVRTARILGVIPARLGSERLPRKPLYPIGGKPLIEWVWRQVSSFSVLQRVVIATDADEIRATCVSFGAEAVLTSPAHRSGTERIAEVIELAGYEDFDVVVNVQGDEPFVRETEVLAAVTQLGEGFDVGTVACAVGTREAWRDPSVVKVTRRADGAALYFSRSPIPHRRDGDPTAAELAAEPYLRHIGIYAYTPAVLRRWVTLEATVLESVERLEQLRALEGGLTIGVGVVAASEAGVDTPADAQRATRRILRDHTAEEAVS
jgi:3-deoxy-manno-octulosonate cytidylyltransferase (CMP-KDO synthetase)